jgi:hypothetical protein
MEITGFGCFFSLPNMWKSEGTKLGLYARLHTAHTSTVLLETWLWECLPHPLYSPMLALSDFHMFGKLEKNL